MKNRYILILFCCLFSFQTAFSQNNGYMGKRFLINVDGVFSPAYFNPNFYGKSGYLHFNYMLSPNIEIIAFKKGTVGVVGHYFNSVYKYQETDYLTDPYFGHSTSFQQNFRCYGFGFFYKQYFRFARAPLGSFFKFELDFLFHEYYPFSSKMIALNPGFKIEFGKDYLFWNRLRVSYGTSIGLTFKGVSGMFETAESHYNASANRVLGVYWLGFRVGIGLLAF